jgi:hypothetical protein
LGENKAGNSADSDSALKPLVQQPCPAAAPEASAVRFWRYGSPQASSLQSPKSPLQCGTNPKLNLLEATSTTIVVRRKKSRPKITGKGLPFNTFSSFIHSFSVDLLQDIEIVIL